MRQDATNENPRRLATAALTFIRMVWLVLRVPVLTCLVILEPVVSFVLGSLALLGLLTAGFLEFIVKQPGFPFGTVLAFSGGCALALLVYYMLIRVFSTG